MRIDSQLWRIIASKLLATLMACGSTDPLVFYENDRPVRQQYKEEDASSSSARWKLSDPKRANLQLDTQFNQIKQVIELRQEEQTMEVIRQIDRPILESTFKQGHNGDSITENFAVSEAGFFDLLIVIDDSSSMRPYQERLSKTLSSILSHISNTNWQIAIATTSSSCLNTTQDGKKILNRADYQLDPATVEEDFFELTRIGEGGNSTERGILTATHALFGECNGITQPWLRPGSSRAVLLVTDEQNCGSAINEGCVGESYEKATYFLDNAPNDVTVHGLLLLEEPPLPNPDNPLDPNNDCIGSGGYENPPNPSQYLELITQTGGLYSDICRANYDSVLEEISASVVDTINFTYELSFPPIDGSEYILIDNRQVLDYLITGNILTVNRSLDTTSESLKISYLHSPSEKFSTITLNENPDLTTLQIFENKRLLNPSEFNYDDSKKQISFDQVPEDRSTVIVRFRENIALPKDFQTEHSFVENTLAVIVNGKPTEISNQNSFNRSFTLKEAPIDNSSIEIIYERTGDRQTRYDAADIDYNKIEEIGAYDLVTNKIIPISLSADNKIIIDQEDVWNARKVVVWYDLLFTGDELSFNVPLKAGIHMETLTISTSNKESSCSQIVDIDRRELNFRCIDDKAEKIDISYLYSSDYVNSFRMIVDNYRPKQWLVKVNNKTTERFNVFGDTVVIDKKALPPGADVRIEVLYQD